jgi:hypothetical protein
LARSKIKKQINEVDTAFRDYPEYSCKLNFHREVLKILLPIADVQTEGMKEVLSPENVNKLLEKVKTSKKPISNFIDSSIFDPNTVTNIANKVTEQLIHIDLELNSIRRRELDVFHKALERGEVDAKDAIAAIMQEDAVWFQNLGDKFGIEPSLVLLIFSTPLRPFFEELARIVEKDLIEIWWEPFCPVCGRSSTIAIMRKGMRYMNCTYCGAQYLVDLFLCPQCGNKDPTSLAFIGFKEHPEYELNYCEKCEHYIKVIYDDRMKRNIPQGLEEILIFELDILAEGLELDLKNA